MLVNEMSSLEEQMVRRLRQPTLEREARGWYHATLPGGMPLDWILDAHEYRVDATMPMVAASLSLTSRLHLDADGQPADYRACALCRAACGAA